MMKKIFEIIFHIYILILIVIIIYLTYLKGTGGFYK